MTEESDSIRNGINDAAIHYRRNQLDKTSSTELNLNGVLASNSSNSKQNNNGSSLGGRLQFFKGKYIFVNCLIYLLVLCLIVTW